MMMHTLLFNYYFNEIMFQITYIRSLLAGIFVSMSGSKMYFKCSVILSNCGLMQLQQPGWTFFKIR